ncbi:MAG: IS1182 family transposase [Fimbriimonadaceae bacterium]|nr:IS1182 family transposase [Fimbriimonadaceae bacterium]
MEWSRAVESREELVLFPTKLDEVIPADHPVRLLDAILRKIDWTPWEAKYKLSRGMPPIHPRVLAGVILFGLQKRIRTSRGLEDALSVRNDFRWLAEGRSIDHTTICKFRQGNSDALKNLFVQIGLIAREMGHLQLQQLGYDGTRIRASNRKSGTRTPKELQAAKVELEAQFQEHQKAIEEAETKEEQTFDAAKQLAGKRKAQTLQDQLAKIDVALEEIKTIEASGKQVPDRLPITDPQSRITKNKEGGFAPNYNPTITVDIASGMIADSDVISGTDEQNHMVPAVERVRENFEIGNQPMDVLADGLMATGENINQCLEKNIQLFSPAAEATPAYREDPSQSLTPEQIAQLPLRGKAPKNGEQDTRTFDKSAFQYDAEQDVYWCPTGQKLERYYESKDHRGDPRYGYRADKQACASCPLKAKCFKNSRDQYGRRIESGEHEKVKQAHASRMQQPESKEIYKRRAPATERPFATIKFGFAVRSFLTRGLGRVRDEWNWIACACNLSRLMQLIQIRRGAP